MIFALLASGGVGTVVAVRILAVRPDWPWAVLLGWLAGLILSLIVFGMLWPFRCPTCGRKLGRKDALGAEVGEPIVFVCPVCRVEWDTGMVKTDIS